MKLSLTNTSKIVTLLVDGAEVDARIWVGHTESGIPVHAYITRIAVDRAHDNAQFEHELVGCEAPTQEILDIPLRLIL